MSQKVSRRTVLTGLVGVTVGASIVGCGTTQKPANPTAGGASLSDSLHTLTTAEAVTLAAVVERLIPSDENGPGAAEAGAAHYIDRALGDALIAFRDTYASGLASIDSYAQSSRGALFAKLPAADQDKVLQDVEQGDIENFTGDPAVFFALLRDHTIQGTFSDPYYGGNVNFVGWDLIGYPGLRMMVTREDQRMGVKLTPIHDSAYNSEAFHRPGSMQHSRAEAQNGD